MGISSALSAKCCKSMKTMNIVSFFFYHNETKSGSTMIKDQTNHLLNGTLQSWRSENQRGEKSKQVILDAGFLKFYLAL